MNLIIEKSGVFRHAQRRKNSWLRLKQNRWSFPDGQKDQTQIPGSRYARPGMTSEILSRPSVRRVLHQIPVSGLLADILFLVVAMALGGVEGNAGRAAGALVA